MSLTYYDLVQHACRYMGGTSTDVTNATHARAAVQAAYRDLCNVHNWTYFKFHGQIVIETPYSTGTISYTNSTRTVTLTDGVWPTWAALGVIVIEDVAYQVVTRESPTAITLSRSSNPGENLAAETSYELYQDTYVLPTDFLSMTDLYIATYNRRPVPQIAPEEMLDYEGHLSPTSPPRAFTILGDTRYQGALAVRFPRPAVTNTLTYLYKRRPRDLRHYQVKDGSVATSSTALTGTGTAFTSSMVGSIIRFSESSTYLPGSLVDEHPYLAERAIVGYTSATSLTLDTALSEELTGVRYTITDPADVEVGAMETLLLRMVDEQVRLQKRMAPKEEERYALEMAKQEAFTADNRNTTIRAAAPTWRYANILN